MTPFVLFHVAVIAALLTAMLAGFAWDQLRRTSMGLPSLLTVDRHRALASVTYFAKVGDSSQ